MKLINGDCLEVLKTIPEGSIDLILCDPPYGMKYQSGHRKVKYRKIENDNNLDWLDDFVKESYRILKDDKPFYCFCSWHNIEIFKTTIAKYFKLKNVLIWVKNGRGGGDLPASYAPSYEICIFATKGRYIFKGYRYADVLFFNKTGDKLHPTQKPVDLLEFLITNSSAEGDMVLDAFMGSGSTGVACKNTGRDFIGIELDKDYFNIAKERIERRID